MPLEEVFWFPRHCGSEVRIVGIARFSRHCAPVGLPVGSIDFLGTALLEVGQLEVFDLFNFLGAALLHFCMCVRFSAEVSNDLVPKSQISCKT